MKEREKEMVIGEIAEMVTGLRIAESAVSKVIQLIEQYGCSDHLPKGFMATLSETYRLVDKADDYGWDLASAPEGGRYLTAEELFRQESE